MRSRQLLAEQQGQVTPQWMKRIARDHYEDTFLQGPYFDAADPDFHSLCMHVSSADFTWRVKGDPVASVSGLYTARNQVVHARFDALEREFEAEVPIVMREAFAVDQAGSRAAILDNFTQRCVHKVHAALQGLLSTFSSS